MMTLPLRAQTIAVAIVSISVTLMALSTLSDSPVVDEIPHIGAGYSYVTRFDMRLNPEHPPLIKDLTGLALVPLLGTDDPVFTRTPWTDDVNGQWQFGRSLLYSSETDPDLIKFIARIPMLGVFVLACYFMWRWARQRYGSAAALFALILFALSPTVLAHGRLVTTDMGAAVGVLVATYFFVRCLKAPSWKSFVWSFFTLGLALLAKFSTVLLGPFFLGVALLYGIDGAWGSHKAWYRAGRLLRLTCFVGIAAFLFIVWPFYIIHTFSYPPERQKSDTQTIMGGYPDTPVRSAILWASDKPLIRGAGQWVMGLALVHQRSAGGNTIYYMGEVVQSGGPGYFPTVYFLKEPLAWWILVSAAITAMIFRHRRRLSEHKRGHFFTDNIDEVAWILWLAIYWIVSIRSTLNIGVRHLLPVFPFAMLLVAGRLSVVIAWLRVNDRLRLRLFSSAVALLLGWYAFESVNVWPHYLSYFNQLAGGPSGGHRYVADSNLDWGQDINRLGHWLKSRGIEKISTDYFGWADPSYYLDGAYVYTTGTFWKDANDFIARNESDGWIAISATFYLEAINRADPGKSTYRWLMDYEPEAIIGNSIFVWHITAHR